MAPAARSMATQAASKRATGASLRAAPCRVGMPRTSMTSLTPKHRPAKGPPTRGGGPSVSASGARWAQARMSRSCSAMVQDDASDSIMMSARAGLLHRDALLTDQRPPQGRFRLDEALEILGRPASDIGALAFDHLAILGVLQGLVDGLVQGLEDVLGNAGRRDHAKPVRTDQVDAQFLESGQVRQGRDACFRGNGQGTDARVVGRQMRDEQA